MYGHADYDRLSPKGQDQARALGGYLAAARIDALYVGPLRRQQDTAALACAGRDLPPATWLGELAEYHAHDLLAHFMPRLLAEQPELAAHPDRAFHAVLGRWSRDEWTHDEVERVTAFAARVKAALDRVIRDLGSGGRAAIVTSAGPIGVAVGLAFGASLHHMIRTSVMIRNASVSELKLRTVGFDWHPDRVSLVAFNSVAHLPAELHTEY